MPRTPGQWAIHDGGMFGAYGDEGPTICAENDDGTCQPMFQLCGPADVEACKANCRLIAAAPEMLELLEELEWDVESTAPGAKGWCPVCSLYAEHEADCRLAAVLKKARGE